ncbi:glycoside hydrolase family 3 protein [uncultured Ferrimonas sp.]|uniref:glycoside hydrolase family 3 protein n=1 Tax=uncultured Ferrimonas sp. TaxID=432640 RepID=UPI0026090D31|nr:glycoside hydrolase family 3 protein [uncultured Ferrimonas sp.]
MSTVRQQLAQRLMIDLRYFAEPEQPQTAVTQLTPSLRQLLQSQQLGGVILFSENCQQPAQLRQLCAELQATSQDLPLLISIDQEGGRVVRTSRDWSTGFAGNMAIGATHAGYGDHFAGATAATIGTELNALGINVVHAPCVDVSNNPDNPVINIRAYGDQPKLVAELAAAACQGFARSGVAATLKHFPGHGDTDTDSHTGLPLVSHALEHLNAIELYPYRQILRQHPPPLLMTAHIQYPALDSSTINGVVRPATLSRRIITELLRDELGYQGVVITDAMDMAALAQLLPMADAVIEAFRAGVDIGLMPVKIRSVADFSQLEQLLDALEQAVTDGTLCRLELNQSYQRICALKRSLNQREQAPLSCVGSVAHRQQEQQLALAAITAIQGQRPEALHCSAKIALLLPGKPLLQGMTQALASASAEQLQLQPVDISQNEVTATTLANCDVVVAGFVSPRQSAAELGGVDDLSLLDEQAVANAYQPQRLQQPLALARQLGKPVVFLSLRAPYDVARFGQYADWVLASYAYHVDSASRCGASLTALAQVLLGAAEARGTLPVTV